MCRLKMCEGFHITPELEQGLGSFVPHTSGLGGPDPGQCRCVMMPNVVVTFLIYVRCIVTPLEQPKVLYTS